MSVKVTDRRHHTHCKSFMTGISELYEEPDIDARLPTSFAMPGLQAHRVGHPSDPAHIAVGLLRHTCGGGLGAPYRDLCAVRIHRRIPQLITVIARDMADWIVSYFIQRDP